MRDVHFDADEEVLGKIYFQDARAIITDLMTGIPSIISVSAGTILVNTPIGKVLDESIRNNTIIHECAHWILHRPAFLLAQLWNRKCLGFACRRTGAAVLQKWTDMDRMEWQANALAPRMLMPDWATRFIAGRWLRRYSRFSPILRMERTIDQLSRHFTVSRQLARIRMSELGYKDADDAFKYYDDRRHTISFKNAVQELARNKIFHDTLASGGYAFADSCFVIRDRKYLCRDESGTLHLTPYAKSHMAECSLSFVARHAGRTTQHGMLRYNAEDEIFVTGSGPSVEILAKQSKAVSDILQGLPNSFSATLIAHMKRKGITTEKLAEKCFISATKLFRIRRDYYSSVSLPTVISLCIGLKLHPTLAMDMVRKAGYCFNTSFEHAAYQTLLFSMTNCSLSECNVFLEQLGIAPLGNEER